MKRKHTHNAGKIFLKFTARLVALIALCLAFLSMPFSTSGQKPQKTRSMMWQIKSGKNTAYVLGSVHVGIKEFYPLPKELEDAFRISDKLLLEVDPTKVDPQDNLLFLAAYGMYGGDDTLWKHVDDNTAARLRTFLAVYNVPSEPFGKLKPFMAAFEIDAISSSKSSVQAQSDLGIDWHFFNEAKGKKKIVGLETTEFHWQIFADQSDDVQVQFLNATLDRLETKHNYLGDVLGLWMKGDEKQIDRVLSEIDREPIKLQRQLREGRNPKMVEALEKCLTSGERCFMVVGTAHVVGKEGIVSTLKRKGYLTKQVKVTRLAK
jgi:uncharacterized protein YbaP (TraB family)